MRKRQNVYVLATQEKCEIISVISSENKLTR